MFLSSRIHLVHDWFVQVHLGSEVTSGLLYHMVYYIWFAMHVCAICGMLPGHTFFEQFGTTIIQKAVDVSNGWG